MASVAALRVLYEDPDLLAVDKPAGLHTAPLRPAEAGTLLSEVIARYPEIASVPGIRPAEPGLLHRLDRETSGVVIVARTAAAFAALRAQFAADQVRKEYLAVCLPQNPEGLTPAPLCVESRFAPYGPGRKKVRVILGQVSGREVTRRLYATEAQVLESRGERALVSAWLLRGFRHQVRAHLSYLGLPILGDPLYGATCPPGAVPRLYLHAAAVALTHPVTGAPLRVVSLAPPEFAAALEPA